MSDRTETARRLLAVRVVRESIFRPGEKFILISPTPEAAEEVADEIRRTVQMALGDCRLPAHLVREKGESDE